MEEVARHLEPLSQLVYLNLSDNLLTDDEKKLLTERAHSITTFSL